MVHLGSSCGRLNPVMRAQWWARTEPRWASADSAAMPRSETLVKEISSDVSPGHAPHSWMMPRVETDEDSEQLS